MPDEQKVAKKIIKKTKKGEVVAHVSDVVIAELEAAPEPRRSKIINLVDGFKIL